MVGYQSTVCISGMQKTTLQWEKPFLYSFGSVYNRDLFVKTSSRDASFFISISDCHCIYFFGRSGDQTQNRMREALEISYVYRDLAKALTDAKKKTKKKKERK